MHTYLHTQTPPTHTRTDPNTLHPTHTPAPHTHTCTYTHTHTYTSTRAHTRTHAHTYTYTHAYKLDCLFSDFSFRYDIFTTSSALDTIARVCVCLSVCVSVCVLCENGSLFLGFTLLKTGQIDYAFQ